MNLPRDLSGEQLIGHLCRIWDYNRTGQVGSHVVLETDTPSHQRIVVPAHKNLRDGTLNAILRIVAMHKSVWTYCPLRPLPRPFPPALLPPRPPPVPGFTTSTWTSCSTSLLPSRPCLRSCILSGRTRQMDNTSSSCSCSHWSSALPPTMLPKILLTFSFSLH